MQTKKMKPLTITESAYLSALQASPSGVARATLATLGKILPTYARESNVVDAHIRNLREKTVDERFEIVTMRGFGYKLINI